MKRLKKKLKRSVEKKQAETQKGDNEEQLSGNLFPDRSESKEESKTAQRVAVLFNTQKKQKDNAVNRDSKVAWGNLFPQAKSKEESKTVALILKLVYSSFIFCGCHNYCVRVCREICQLVIKLYQVSDCQFLL